MHSYSSPLDGVTRTTSKVPLCGGVARSADKVPLCGGVARSAGVVYFYAFHAPIITKPQKNNLKNLRHSRQGGNLLRRRHFYAIPHQVDMIFATI